MAEIGVIQRVVPMQYLCAGERGRICGVDGRRELVVRLGEMGMRHGADVRMVQPGSPCIVAINNHRMTFRGDNAATILVELDLVEADGERSTAHTAT